jgi:hypothetical protein
MPAPLPLTPLEQAALLASSATRTRIKRQHALLAGGTVGVAASGGDTAASIPAGPGMSTCSQAAATVKCFFAGVRWGVSLPQALLSAGGRPGLASALNDAYAGAILSCGRGDALRIVFLDAGGRLTEFPPLRGGEGGSGAGSGGGRGEAPKDNASRWKAAADKAVRVYVAR